jgi:hypothetical protein
MPPRKAPPSAASRRCPGLPTPAAGAGVPAPATPVTGSAVKPAAARSRRARSACGVSSNAPTTVRRAVVAPDPVPFLVMVPLPPVAAGLLRSGVRTPA